MHRERLAAGVRRGVEAISIPNKVEAAPEI
jgi:hypothetical protein